MFKDLYSDIFYDVNYHNEILLNFKKYGITPSVEMLFELNNFDLILSREGILDSIKNAFTIFIKWVKHIGTIIANFFKRLFGSNTEKINNAKTNINEANKKERSGKDDNLDKIVIPNAVSYEQLSKMTVACNEVLQQLGSKNYHYYEEAFSQIFTSNETSKFINHGYSRDNSLDELPYAYLVDMDFYMDRFRAHYADLSCELKIIKESNNQDRPEFQEFYKLYRFKSQPVFLFAKIKSSLFEDNTTSTLGELGYTLPRVQDVLFTIEKDILTWSKKTTKLQDFIKKMYEESLKMMKEFNRKAVPGQQNTQMANFHWFGALIPFQQDCATYLQMTTILLDRTSEITGMINHIATTINSNMS